MKLVTSSLLVAFASSALVAAAPAQADPSAPAKVEAVSPERLDLARKFMAATESDDFIESMHEAALQTASAGAGSAEEKASMERFVKRVFVLAEPAIRKRQPVILETYAQLYAREFSADELQQMTAFAQSPAGKHYLSKFAFLDADPSVVAAQAALWEDLTPVMENVRKEMCAEKAAKRVAMGDKKAKCPLSDPETQAG